jgi:hypothetical protein
MTNMKILASVFAIALAFAVVGAAQAAPTGAAWSNPNVVAFYTSGPHGIPGEPFYHEGMDLVMRMGNTGNFQQWFYGDSEEPVGVHGDHSVWKVMKNGECNGVVMHNPYPAWGDYLTPDVDYCVTTNDYHPSNND